MKRSIVLFSLITASLASATPSDSDAKEVVEKKLIAPLKVKEAKQSRFSRAYLPPQVRRVRVLDEKPLADSQGAEFMMFAVDVHHGYDADDPSDGSKHWRKDAMMGCVYSSSGEVFVKRGDSYIAGNVLLGKKTSKPGEHVCKSTATQAQVAAAK